MASLTYPTHAGGIRRAQALDNEERGDQRDCDNYGTYISSNLTPFLFGMGNILDKISSPVSSYRSKIPNVDDGVRCIASGFLQMFPPRETRDYLPRSIRFERLMYPDLAYRQSLLCMTCATRVLSAAFITPLHAPFKLQLRVFFNNPKKLSSKNILSCLTTLFRSLSYSSSGFSALPRHHAQHGYNHPYSHHDRAKKDSWNRRQDPI